MKWALLLGFVAVFLSAQSVQVYSEFAQLNHAGEVVAPENPREILSPAVPRNACSSFQLAIQVPRGAKFLVYIGQNPDNAVKVTLYRRDGWQAGADCDALRRCVVTSIVDGSLGERRCSSTPRENRAAIGIGGNWVTYPDGSARDGRRQAGGTPAVRTRHRRAVRADARFFVWWRTASAARQLRDWR